MTMELHTLKPAPGAKRPRKRVGRGNGSGHGSYSGRGCKGQKSRAGYSRKPGFEGGQLPLIKRLPRKRGFTNIFRVEYNPVSLDKLNAFEAGSTVGVVELRAAGIVRSLRKPVKILANGKIDRALTVTANKFSVAARAAIEAAGGTAVVLTKENAEEAADAAKAN
jgi:large subunit ribosomal protein L15